MIKTNEDPIHLWRLNFFCLILESFLRKSVKAPLLLSYLQGNKFGHAFMILASSHDCSLKKWLTSISSITNMFEDRECERREEKKKEKRKTLSVNGTKELETSYTHFHAFGLNIKKNVFFSSFWEINYIVFQIFILVIQV